MQEQQNNATIPQQSEKKFEQFSWPQREQTQPVEEHRSPQGNTFNSLYNTQHLEELSLQDFVLNGQFPMNGFQPTQWENPENICHQEAQGIQDCYIKEQYNMRCSEPVFDPAGQIKTDPDELPLRDGIDDDLGKQESLRHSVGVGEPDRKSVV